LLKFMSGVHMCEKVGGKRPNFWPLAEALAAVFTLICSFYKMQPGRHKRPALFRLKTPHLMHSCSPAAVT
jgi:hypothetical protein